MNSRPFLRRTITAIRNVLNGYWVAPFPYEQCQDAVVRVRTQHYNDDGAEVDDCWATGFFVSKNGDVITAYHNVAQVKGLTTKVRVYPRVDAENNYVTAKLVRSDPDADIARLVVPGIKWPFLPIGDSTQVRRGSRLFYIGFPGGEQNTGHSFNDFLITNLNFNGGFRGELSTGAGASGSPILDWRGEVVGVLISGTPTQVYVVPEAEIRSFTAFTRER